jgi:ATP synthase I chain
MTEPLQETPAEEAFLSRAYQRILRITVVLSVAATMIVTILLGWRSGLGVAIGAPIAYINLVWLHQGSTMMVERMIASSSGAATPSKARLVLAFAGRYALMIALVCVILKSFPGMRLGFMMGLVAPIAAATCEGIYEAVANGKSSNK